MYAIRSYYGLLEIGTYLFDPLHSLIERESTQRRLTGGLVVVFLLGLLGISYNFV